MLIATGAMAFFLPLAHAFDSPNLGQATSGAGVVRQSMPWETVENRNLLFYKPFPHALTWRTLEVKSVESWKANAGPTVAALEQEIRLFKTKGTGFYRTALHRNRWWLIDPDGKLFLSAGVNELKPSLESADFKGRFRDGHHWAQLEQARLKEWGFNTAGQGSDTQLLREHAEGLAFTVTRWPGWQDEVGPLEAFFQEKAKETTRPRSRKREMVMPVFHPDFEGFVLKMAPALAGFAKERNLLGYYLDKDLPYPSLEAYLTASSGELHRGAREAAVAWLERRGRKPEDYGGTDAEQWPGYVFSQYCKKIVPVIRRYDPNHLVLGPRLSSKCLRSSSVMSAVGEECDIVAVLSYGKPVPTSSEVASWHQFAGKPVLIAELSASVPSLSAGFEEQARGWVVPDQAQKGKYYEGFVMECLKSQACVGWHWQQYQDRPDQLSETRGLPIPTSPGPLDAKGSNGIILAGFQPHPGCLDGMKNINLTMYAIASSGLTPELGRGPHYWFLLVIPAIAAAFVAWRLRRSRTAGKASN